MPAGLNFSKCLIFTELWRVTFRKNALFFTNFTSLSFFPPIIAWKKQVGEGVTDLLILLLTSQAWDSHCLSFSSGCAGGPWPALPAHPTVPACQGLPSRSGPWAGRVSPAETTPGASGASRWPSQGGPGRTPLSPGPAPRPALLPGRHLPPQLALQSAFLLRFLSQVWPPCGHWARRRRHLPRPQKRTSPQVPFATTSTGACKRHAEERKTSPRQGRPGPASPTKSSPAKHPGLGAAGSAGSEVRGPARCARPPRRAPYP